MAQKQVLALADHSDGPFCCQSTGSQAQMHRPTSVTCCYQGGHDARHAQSADMPTTMNSPDSSSHRLHAFHFCLLTQQCALYCCRGKNEQATANLLDAQASTKYENKLGLTPLAEAIVSGRIANAELLLEQVSCRNFVCNAQAYVAVFISCSSSSQ